MADESLYEEWLEGNPDAKKRRQKAQEKKEEVARLQAAKRGRGGRGGKTTGRCSRTTETKKEEAVRKALDAELAFMEECDASTSAVVDPYISPQTVLVPHRLSPAKYQSNTPDADKFVIGKDGEVREISKRNAPVKKPIVKRKLDLSRAPQIGRKG